VPQHFLIVLNNRQRARVNLLIPVFRFWRAELTNGLRSSLARRERATPGKGFCYGTCHCNDGATMNHQIVRVLPNFEAAEAARKGLLAEGFDSEGIDVNVTSDEAGPTESHFFVGDSPEVKGGTDYKDVFKPAARGDLCMMTVTVADASQLERAAAILEYNGGIDINASRRS
jgi:hypothetical protein